MPKHTHTQAKPHGPCAGPPGADRDGSGLGVVSHSSCQPLPSIYCVPGTGLADARQQNRSPALKELTIHRAQRPEMRQVSKMVISAKQGTAESVAGRPGGPDRGI